MFIFDNGDIIPLKHSNVSPHNRSFRYGDGLFETMFMEEGRIPFLDKHLSRIERGMQILKIEIPNWNVNLITNISRELSVLNAVKSKAKVRLMVYRGGEGLYTPQHNQANFLIECNALTKHDFRLKKKGMNLGIYAEIPKNYTILSPFKTNNALPYILAGIYKKIHQKDECILFNQHARVADAIYHNVWGISDNKVMTPAISEGGVAGVMRAVLLELLQEHKIEVVETELPLEVLCKCEEIWLSNAVNGIEWVDNFEGKNYQNKLAIRVSSLLAKKVMEKLNNS